MTNVTAEIDASLSPEPLSYSSLSFDIPMEGLEESYQQQSSPYKIAQSTFAVVSLECPDIVPDGLGYFPLVPSLVQEHIISFVDHPQRLKTICKAFRDVIVPNAIFLQVQRLQENFRAVKALFLADIIDLTPRVVDRAEAEKIHGAIANRLEEFFNRASTPFHHQASVFELIADPDELATCIFTVYLWKIIDILLKMSPHFAEAGTLAHNLMVCKVDTASPDCQAYPKPEGKSETEGDDSDQKGIVLLSEAPIKNSESSIELAMSWAQQVQERCAAGIIPCFSIIVTDGTFKSSEQMWLPLTFLSSLSRVPLSLFGVLKMVGPNTEEVKTS